MVGLKNMIEIESTGYRPVSEDLTPNNTGAGELQADVFDPNQQELVVGQTFSLEGIIVVTSPEEPAVAVSVFDLRRNQYPTEGDSSSLIFLDHVPEGFVDQTTAMARIGLPRTRFQEARMRNLLPNAIVNFKPYFSETDIDYFIKRFGLDSKDRFKFSPLLGVLGRKNKNFEELLLQKPESLLKVRQLGDMLGVTDAKLYNNQMYGLVPVGIITRTTYYSKEDVVALKAEMSRVNFNPDNSENISPEGLLTTAELCEQLGIERRYFSAHIKPSIAPVGKIGNAEVYKMEDLDRAREVLNNKLEAQAENTSLTTSKEEKNSKVENEKRSKANLSAQSSDESNIDQGAFVNVSPPKIEDIWKAGKDDFLNAVIFSQERLTADESNVIDLLYALGGGESLSVTEVARRMQIKDQRVLQILNGAIAKLRVIKR